MMLLSNLIYWTIAFCQPVKCSSVILKEQWKLKLLKLLHAVFILYLSSYLPPLLIYKPPKLHHQSPKSLPEARVKRFVESMFHAIGAITAQYFRGHIFRKLLSFSHVFLLWEIT